MNLYKFKRNHQAGFSIIGAVLGVVVGVVTFGTATPLAIALVAGSGAVGGLLGGTADKGAQSGDGSAAGTQAGTDQASADQGADCGDVQSQFNDMQAQYEAAKQRLQQSQQNLNNASPYATSTSNDYNTINNACFPGSDASTNVCGSKNSGGCDELQNQCNQLKALIDSTNQAACQVQDSAMKILPGGTASSTANPIYNTFTLGLTPNSIEVGGTFALVTTITLANNTTNILKSFSIRLFDTSNNTVGDLAANIKVQATTSAEVKLQYNFQLPSTIKAGAYVVKIFNDDNPAESEKAALTVVGVGQAGTANNFQTQGTAAGANTGVSTNTSGAFDLIVSPATIYQGSPFTVKATIKSPATLSYSINAMHTGVSLGSLVSRAPVGTTARPAYVQQNIKTASTIPPGTYSVQIVDDGNSTQNLSATLTVLAGSAPAVSSGSGFTNTNSAGSPVSYSNANICTLGVSLSMGSRDSNTGGGVSALQKFLTSKGTYSYQVTGYFGAITKAAVKTFQAANGVPSTGFVGSLTRQAIKNSPPCK